jgi:hypothetical protein
VFFVSDSLNSKVRSLWVTIFLSFTTTATAFAQVPLGIGIVEVEFDGKTVVDSYKTPTDKTYSKRLEFFDDKSINATNLKNLNEEKNWLKPQSLWIDYYEFHLRCKSSNNGWLEVIVNNENGQTYWLERRGNIKFFTWEEYLKEMFAVGRMPGEAQKIRESPVDNAGEIKYEGIDCFKVRSLRGDWIEIFTSDYCGADSKMKIKSGWIKWRNGDRIIIELFSTS